MDRLGRLEAKAIDWMARNALALLRMSVGIVFLWFGLLKFFPGLSPAQDLVARTVRILTFGVVPPAISVPVLAAWECLIGLGLVTGRCLRGTLALLFLQMSGTILPLFFFPHETFTRVPFAATLEGQYIIKNMVIVSAGLVIGATVRGGALVADPGVRAPTAPKQTYAKDSERA
ncbi:MAG TPA: DoxX family protein [Anaeromyxobacteraceae bacterium]|nr:DoxX family protein [Anaeromyxobacteraceae bacterium]